MITQKRLKYLIHYNPDTGLFSWKEGRHNQVKKGLEAGFTHCRGYVHICVCGKQYKAHRLAFLYMEGFFPEFQVDHKNGVRDDNRWKNLRHVSQSCNRQNQKTNSRNKSGFAGVSRYKETNRWLSQAGINRNKVYLGIHNTALEAALARLTWEVQCPAWTCNNRGGLVKEIMENWPDFNTRSLQ